MLLAGDPSKQQRPGRDMLYLALIWHLEWDQTLWPGRAALPVMRGSATNLHHLKLFQTLLYKLLYLPLLALLLIFSECISRAPSRVCSEVVICKLRRLTE